MSQLGSGAAVVRGDGAGRGGGRDAAGDAEAGEAAEVTRVDYARAESLFAGVRFIHECGQKLSANVLTVATASCLFHKFFSVAKKNNHCQYLVATACLYVSGKLEEPGGQLKIRDLVNVVHSTMQRSSESSTVATEPLGLDSGYYAIRDNVCQAELLVLRMVGFQTAFSHPHKYLLHYLSSLRAWMSGEVWARFPIARTAWAILQDFYHDSRILSVVDPTSSSSSSSSPRLSASHLSVGCIHLALQTFGISVPYVGDAQRDRGEPGRGRGNAWYNAFCRDLTRERLSAVSAVLMEVYNGDDAHVKTNYTTIKEAKS